MLNLLPLSLTFLLLLPSSNTERCLFCTAHKKNFLFPFLFLSFAFSLFTAWGTIWPFKAFSRANFACHRIQTHKVHSSSFSLPSVPPCLCHPHPVYHRNWQERRREKQKLPSSLIETPCLPGIKILLKPLKCHRLLSLSLAYYLLFDRWLFYTLFLSFSFAFYVFTHFAPVSVVCPSLSIDAIHFETEDALERKKKK